MKKIHIVVQEGGTATELYVHAYDHHTKACKGVKAYVEDSYRTLGPLTVPPNLTRALLSSEGAEQEFYSFLELTLREAATQF